MNDFLKQLGEKLKAAGLPLAEHDAEVLYKVFSDHVKGFKYDNDLAKAIAPAAMIALDVLALAQIDKIDGQPG